MNETIDKLEEAGFFLQQMEANYLEHPTFNYFFSAFISSARSVLWIMRSEYHDIKGWESWYQSREPSADEEVLLKKVNAARVRTEKQSHLKTQFRVNLVVPQEYATDELRQALESYLNKTVRGSAQVVDEDSEEIDFVIGDVALTFRGRIETVHRVLDEFADEDILEVSRKYYSMLKEIVAECERRFG